jgi:hypothetical protein
MMRESYVNVTHRSGQKSDKASEALEASREKVYLVTGRELWLPNLCCLKRKML